MATYKKIKKSFEAKYQLILRNVATFSEDVSHPFSYTTLVIVVTSWFCLNFCMGLFLAKTALAKWMNPMYIEKENQKKITSLASLVETLEQQIDTQTTFITTLQAIIQGKSKKNRLPREQAKEQEEPMAINTTPSLATHATANPNPSSLEANHHAENLKKITKTSREQYSGLLFPPMSGIITKCFNSQDKHYGVDIVAGDKTPIKAISAGIVIFSDWSVGTGWVLAIQHYNNLVSISKHCSVLFKKVGNLVQSGDVVALMGNSGELSTGPHLHFELWSEGVALNPEDFINF